MGLALNGSQNRDKLAWKCGVERCFQRCRKM